ncbi:diacylglycerol/lipid kinase family protein [Arthrobacter burdickii]|uniref:Diacylglycerol kinase family lipid kinase n=1 Tax=Arthrobacter burdickii TaxID=3035920 RepID=A0ABT8K1S0_9MICC|nr:diacylglycerol kinase family protein [Arthrobacter burdickii]MDN4611378.1 diacylglycerol kinase family lipid kinase [Arthrobacter burdickii]
MPRQKGPRRPAAGADRWRPRREPRTLPGAGGDALLLVSPTAGRGRARRLAPRTAEALRRAGFTVSTVMTGSLREATERARTAAPGSVVAALGGDGFLGAVAAGARDSGAVLLPLAGGRANDAVRRLGLPLNPVRAVRALPRYEVTAIDLGQVNGRPYLGVAHVGFDALANEYGNATRVALGPFVYLYGGLKAFRAWRGVTFTLSVDGTERVFPGWFVAVGNGGQYGGGLRICPRAKVDDGLLDVVSLGRSSFLTVVATFLLSYRGRHLGRRGIAAARGSSVRITADEPLNVYADGELVGPLPAAMTIAPRALKVLMPADSPALH